MPYLRLRLSPLLTSRWVRMLTTGQVRPCRSYTVSQAGSTKRIHFPKRGTDTLFYDYITCVSVRTLTSAENTASQVLDTLNKFSGRLDNTAITAPGEKEQMVLSAHARLLLRLQRHFSTDANRKTSHSGAQSFTGELGPGLPTRQV